MIYFGFLDTCRHYEIEGLKKGAGMQAEWLQWKTVRAQLYIRRLAAETRDTLTLRACYKLSLCLLLREHDKLKQQQEAEPSSGLAIMYETKLSSIFPCECAYVFIIKVITDQHISKGAESLHADLAPLVCEEDIFQPFVNHRVHFLEP